MTGHDETNHGEVAAGENTRDPALERLIERVLDQAPAQHLDDDQLAALFGEELSESERGELVDRLIADPDALGKIKSLRPLRAWSDGVAGAIEESRRFEARGSDSQRSESQRAKSQRSESQRSESRRSEAQRSESRRRERRRPVRRWALAASLLAVIGAGFLLPQLGLFENPETLRTPAAAIAPVAIEPADGARLSAAPSSFVFSIPGEPGRTFTVMLFDESSTLLWRSPTVNEERVELPSEVAQELAGGRTYLWRVSSDDGLDERRWPLASFEIIP